MSTTFSHSSYKAELAQLQADAKRHLMDNGFPDVEWIQTGSGTFLGFQSVMFRDLKTDKVIEYIEGRYRKPKAIVIWTERTS